VPGTDPDVVDSYATLAERAAEMTHGFEDEVAVLDIETTGYDAERDRIIEVAVAIMHGPEVLSTFSTVVDPLVPIPLEITKLTGIDDEMVAGAPCAEAAVAQLAEFVGERDIVAHNGSFDRSFIERVGGKGVLPGRWLDSLVFVRLGMPRLRSHRLADLGAAFAPSAGGIDGAAPRAHRAPDDVAALCVVWRCALAGIADLDRGVLERIANLAPEAEWPERDWVARISAATGHDLYDLKEVRRRRVAADKAEAMHDADEVACTCPTPEEVAVEFSAGGIAGKMYPGFEKRAEQVEMARAVLNAFDSGTHLAIEAGTGVGKSRRCSRRRTGWAWVWRPRPTR